MSDWVAIGGGNSGCCGDPKHKYGFHLPGKAVPTSDYSRSHEDGRPANMDWACAGDFGHRGVPELRARHAAVLAGLMAGKYPMIAEFIGQPYASKPVYYWARWQGISILQQYKGTGHDSWSHISWWRSRASERPHFWAGPTAPIVPVPPKPSKGPAYPGYNMAFNPRKYDVNVGVFQARMRARGWRIQVDRCFGPDTLRVVKAFQKEKHLIRDDVIGPQTWAAAWSANVT